MSVIERCWHVWDKANGTWRVLRSPELATRQIRRGEKVEGPFVLEATAQGAVATVATIADELRALGQEWREEWPDGRVCKSALNEIADRLTALSSPRTLAPNTNEEN